MSEEQFKKILGLRRFLFPNLPPTAGITEGMIDKRLKAIVDQPARVGNEILVLRMREENGQHRKRNRAVSAITMEAPIEQLIPNPIDQNPWVHWRSPMDMMRQG